jgi:hypothetical protein
LKQVVQHLLKHHDALRLQFVESNSGWQQSNAELNQVEAFTYFDLSMLSADEQISAMEIAATEIKLVLICQHHC